MPRYSLGEKTMPIFCANLQPENRTTRPRNHRDHRPDPIICISILMYYIIYSSFATNPFAEGELQALLTKSHRNNQQSGVTGFLYYYSNSFLQLIEGDEEAVKALYQRVATDSRHKDLLILKEDHIDVRFYPDWTMGYRFMSPDEVKQLAIYPVNDGAIDPLAVLRLFNITATK